MKNRYMLLLTAMFIGSQLNAISSNNIAQAVKQAHNYLARNGSAFSKTGRISPHQRYSLSDRIISDLSGKNTETYKQRMIDKLHTKKRFWMAYSASTTAIILNACQDFCYKTYNDIMSHNYDGPNPFAAAEKAANDAALL